MSPLPPSAKSSSGFTLVEVLVAMVIVAVVASSAYLLLSSQARLIGTLNERAKVGLLAWNRAVELLIGPKLNVLSDQSLQVEAFGKNWIVDQKVRTTLSKDVSQVEIRPGVAGVEPQSAYQLYLYLDRTPENSGS